MRSVGPAPLALLTAFVSLSAIGMAALAADPIYEQAVASFNDADYEQEHDRYGIEILVDDQSEDSGIADFSPFDVQHCALQRL